MKITDAHKFVQSFFKEARNVELLFVGYLGCYPVANPFVLFNLGVKIEKYVRLFVIGFIAAAAQLNTTEVIIYLLGGSVASVDLTLSEQAERSSSI